MALALQLRDDTVRLLRHLLVDVLALLVVLVDVLCLGERMREVFLHEQVYALASVLHTSRRIDARTYLEHDVAH